MKSAYFFLWFDKEHEAYSFIFGMIKISRLCSVLLFEHDYNIYMLTNENEAVKISKSTKFQISPNIFLNSVFFSISDVILWLSYCYFLGLIKSQFMYGFVWIRSFSKSIHWWKQKEKHLYWFVQRRKKKMPQKNHYEEQQ